MIKEYWKPVVGFEGYYEVSNLNKVRSIDRWIVYKNGAKHFCKGKLLKFSVSEDGYYRVHLTKNGHITNMNVHRIMAFAFLPIPEHLKKHIGTQQLQINHKDENKQNNVIFINDDGSIDYEKTNIEWCDSLYNNTYNDRHSKCAKKIRESSTERYGKPVRQLTMDGELVAVYPSTREAARATGFIKQGIMIACHGGQWRKGKWVHTFAYKGYKWEYEC